MDISKYYVYNKLCHFKVTQNQDDLASLYEDLMSRFPLISCRRR